MPKPPNFDPVTDLKFITNYQIVGCGSNATLLFELSTPALKSLVLLLVSPSIDDFVQGVLDPKGGRTRRSGRHGRKSGRGFGLPDPNDLVANKLAGPIHGYTPVKMGLTKYAWGGFQMYEGLNFAAALVDGLTNTHFDHLWGVMDIDSQYCREFARIARHWDDYGISGGLSREWVPLNLPDLDFTVDFFDGNFGTGTSKGDWHGNLKVRFMGLEGLPPATFNLQLRNQHGEVRAESGELTIGPGEFLTIEINGECKGSDFISWGTTINEFNFAYLRADFLGFLDVPVF